MAHDDAFALDPRLVETARVVLDAPLSRVLLADDARWPWVVLVPKRAGLRELTDLTDAERALLWRELDAAGAAVRAIAPPERPAVKLNIAALGNLVPQLHVHVVVRRPDDPAWPGPIWGVGQREAYAPVALEVAIAHVRHAFAALGTPLV